MRRLGCRDVSLPLWVGLYPLKKICSSPDPQEPPEPKCPYLDTGLLQTISEDEALPEWAGARIQ